MFLLVLALSFHAVFEGLAVGLEEKQEDVWTLFAGEENILTEHQFHLIGCAYM